MLFFVGLEVFRDKDCKDKEKVNRISSKMVLMFYFYNCIFYYGYYF